MIVLSYELGLITISYMQELPCAKLLIKDLSPSTLAPLFMGVFIYIKDVRNLSDRSTSLY